MTEALEKFAVCCVHEIQVVPHLASRFLVDQGCDESEIRVDVRSEPRQFEESKRRWPRRFHHLVCGLPKIRTEHDCPATYNGLPNRLVAVGLAGKVRAHPFLV